MISDILLLKMPGSLSTLEFPLLPSAYTIPEEYIVHEAKSTKHSRDLNQTVKVDFFDGYDTPNMALIGDDFYWITGYRDITLQKEIIEYDLAYCAPTSKIRKGDALKGMWERTPVLMSKHLPNAVMSSSMYQAERHTMDRMRCFKADVEKADRGPIADFLASTKTVGQIWWVTDPENGPLYVDAAKPVIRVDTVTSQDSYTTSKHTLEEYTDPMYWVEVTAITNFYPCVREDEPNKLYYTRLNYDAERMYGIKDESSMCKYGFFARYSEGLKSGRLGCAFDTNNLNKWYHYTSQGSAGATADAMSAWPAYPSIEDLIQNPDTSLGFPQDDILDVSISEWCPYQWNVGSTTILGDNVDFSDYDSHYEGQTTTVSYAYIITDPDWVWGSYVDILVQGKDRVSMPITGGWYAIYPKLGFYFLGRIGAREFKMDNWDAHKLIISSMQKACGKVALQDANGNMIADIPNELFVEDSEGRPTLEYRAQVYSDSTGLFTRVDIGAADSPHIITIPMGKLPWVGDSWDQYRCRDMAYDREQLENTKKQAWENFAVSVFDSVAGAANTYAFGAAGGGQMLGRSRIPVQGATAAVSGAAGIVSGALSTQTAIRAAEREQALTEKRVKGQPGTGYNTGYGIQYCDNAQTIGAGFVVLMPKGLTDDYYEAFTAYHGFPAEGELTVTAQAGYHKGRLYTDGDSGLKFDALNNDLSVGFRFVEMEEPAPAPTPAP